jgi:hypothetical protein
MNIPVEGECGRWEELEFFGDYFFKKSRENFGINSMLTEDSFPQGNIQDSEQRISTTYRSTVFMP